VDIVIKAVDGKVPVLAGTGSNNTEEAILLTKYAKEAGAAGSLLITPYYNRPSQEGLYIHFKKIAEEVDIPIVLYNVPGRTGVNLLPETIEKLSTISNIVGIKEATGSLAQASEIVSRCGMNFDVISGDDVNALPIMAIGGKGVISVTANIAPKEVASMVHAFEDGRIDEARKLHYKLFSLNSAMFLQTNPIPVKTALGMMGKISSEMRLPLCPMPDELNEKLRNVLKTYKLIV
jgi:4-hydroxy-tetrahydrodipicolinate synthase